MKRKLCLALAFFLLLVCVLPSRASALPQTVKPSGGGSSSSSSSGKTEVKADGASTALFYISSYDFTGASLEIGTGVMISSDGKAVTTYRAIKNAHRLKITFLNKSEYEVESVLGYDIEKDIAIIKLKGTNFPYLKLVDSSKTAKSDAIYTAEYYGSGNHLKEGAVLNPAAVCDDGRTLIELSVTPSLNGAALLNRTGGLIGIAVRAKLGGKAQGFAIPSAQLMAVSQKTPKKLSEAAADYDVYCYEHRAEVSKTVLRTEDIKEGEYLENGAVVRGVVTGTNTDDDSYYIRCNSPGFVILFAKGLNRVQYTFMAVNSENHKGIDLSASERIINTEKGLYLRFYIDKPTICYIYINKLNFQSLPKKDWEYQLSYEFIPDAAG